jgi:hypothetical protein
MCVKYPQHCTHEVRTDRQTVGSVFGEPNTQSRKKMSDRSRHRQLHFEARYESSTDHDNSVSRHFVPTAIVVKHSLEDLSEGSLLGSRL